MAVIKYNNKQFNLGLMSVKSDSPASLAILGTGKSGIVISERELGGNKGDIILIAQAFNEIRKRININGVVDITDIIDHMKKEPTLNVVEEVRSAKQKSTRTFYFSYMATLFSMEEPFTWDGSVYSLKEGGYEIKLTTKPQHGMYFAYYLNIQPDKYREIESKYKDFGLMLAEALKGLNEYTRQQVREPYVEDFTDKAYNYLRSNFAVSRITLAKKQVNKR